MSPLSATSLVAEPEQLSMTNSQEKAIMEGVRAKAYTVEEVPPYWLATSLLRGSTGQTADQQGHGADSRHPMVSHFRSAWRSRRHEDESMAPN